MISRSDAARALGIKMGVPWFKISDMADSDGVVALSANFALYGDISDRMMSLAAGLGLHQEIYSIDESFISMAGMPGDLVERSRRVRLRILRWIGIPGCVGIGPTKTVAKLANHIAKNAERKPGSYPSELAQVCHLGIMPQDQLYALMECAAVGEVWGVGRRIEEQFKEAGVQTVLDLVKADVPTIRKRWGVVLERTVRELQGISCIALEEESGPRKEIACTRSFGAPVTSLPGLIEAVTEFATRAAAIKLRTQKSLVNQVMVIAHTSPFKPVARFSPNCIVPLPAPTGDTRQIVGAAVAGVRRMFEPGYQLSKAGVILMDLQPEGVHQGMLDLGGLQEDQTAWMSALDYVNRRLGRGTISVVSGGTPQDTRGWHMRQERKTPSYTTS